MCLLKEEGMYEGLFWHSLLIPSSWVQRTGSFQSKIMMVLSIWSYQELDGLCPFFYLQIIQGLVSDLEVLVSKF